MLVAPSSAAQVLAVRVGDAPADGASMGVDQAANAHGVRETVKLSPIGRKRLAICTNIFGLHLTLRINAVPTEIAVLLTLQQYLLSKQALLPRRDTS